MISAAEIKEAVAKMLKKGAQGDVASVEESVDQLFQLLDSDKDGKVSIMELLQYIQKRKESVELEAMEVGNSLLSYIIFVNGLYHCYYRRRCV